jgi:GTPase
MKSSLITISAIGRPNVGKSTFFNKLIGRSKAIVDDTPGVTRDRRYAIGNIGPYEFNIVDTAGLENNIKGEIEKQMGIQTAFAIEESDIVFFMIDGISGVLEEDKKIARWLRKFNKHVVLLMNKSENQNKIESNFYDAYKLGFGEPLCISAEHKLGFNDLIDIIAPICDKKEKEFNDDDGFIDVIQVSIIGRPNAGKSTLINALLNQERTIASSIAGTTRDSIMIDWSWGDYKIKLVDTAGIRRKTKITEKIEQLSIDDAKNAINFSHVVVVLIDATCFLEHQDLALIELTFKEGRSVVLAVNKWDLIKSKSEIKKEIMYQVSKTVQTAGAINIEFISAKDSEKLPELMDSIISTYNVWNTRVSTSKLNNWLRDVTSEHPVPLNSKKKRPKLKYITQYKSRPPAFMISSNFPDDIIPSYQKYLMNSLREHFGFSGVPIRLSFKKSDNPYQQ